MFRRLPDPAATIVFDFEGTTFEACDGDSVAAALLDNGVLVFRTTPVSGAPRGPWCLIGNCHECLVEIDGEPNRQACMVEVRAGMRVRRQRGARAMNSIPVSKKRMFSPASHTERKSRGNAMSTFPWKHRLEDRARREFRQPGRGDSASSSPEMSETVGLAIIGAGPAGMSAAIVAREHGTDVLVLDEQAAPGGQIYRNVETVVADRPDAARVLGGDYAAGAALVRAFRGCGAEHSPRTSVWEVSTVTRREDARAPLELGILRNGVAEIVRAHCVIVASGAQERAVPVPGATLPGVMGAGGAQSLLKGAGLVPEVPVVIAGSGPLVYLVAWQLVCAGTPVRAVLLTMPVGWMGRAAGTLPEALAMPGALRKGVGWWRALAARGVNVMQVSNLAIEGRDRVESVRFRHRGQEQSMRASLVLLHEGVVPNAHLTLAAQLDHVWDARQHAFRPTMDEWGRTSEPGVLVAGDGARILGAEAAVETGRIAALEAAYRLGRIRVRDRDLLAGPHRAPLARHRRFREFLDHAFGPGAAALRPADPAVTVCRCEEVTAGEIERVIAGGCPGPNQAKAFTRCGMGPCQGRMCATVVSEMFAERRRAGVGAVGCYRIRPPVKPVTVGELAGLGGTGAAGTDRAS